MPSEAGQKIKLALPTSRIAWMPYAAAALIAAVAITVLIGWQLHMESLKRIMPTWVAMNPTTALGLLLCVGSLIIFARVPKAPVWTLWTARTFAAIVSLFGLLMIVALMGGPDLHLDQLLYDLHRGASVHVDAATQSNRVAPNTALIFMLLGVSLLISRLNNPVLRILSKATAVICSLIAMVAAMGYFNGVASLYRPTTLTPMAFHTACSFLLLALGILTLDFHAGLPLVAGARGHTNPTDLSAVKKKMTLGFGVALFLLALIGVVAFASIQTLAAASRDGDRSHRIVQAASDISETLSDAETSVDAYIITGELALLNPYTQALEKIHAQLQAAALLAAGDPAQQQQLAALTPAIEARFALLRHVVDLCRAGPEDAGLLLTTTQGRQISESIHADLEQLRAAELALQQKRDLETSHTNDITTLFITAGILIAFSIVGFAGWIIRRDLAEKQEVSRQLRIARLEAEEANAAKSRFLANMSHEIRTPMAAIIGYADLVLDPHQTPSDRVDYINTIRRNGEHLLTLINDILDLSKIEADKVELDRTQCCPCHILSDVASLMRIRATEKNIRLEIRNEGLIPAKVRTDPARLRQILINLVGNAIKFTDDGWVRLIMKLEESPKPLLRFDIIDTGIGMNGEQITKLFRPFAQADVSTTRRFGGTGLGLTISKRLAEMLGGTITLDSSPGRGSTFTVTVDPGSLDGVKRLHNCREALTGAESERLAPAASTVRGRILLVDDGEDNRRLLSVYLRQAGAEVTLAENGRIGVEKALAALNESNPFDVILMDMQMPELDGYGATSLLRSKGYKGTIIALTANAMAEDCDKCLSIGCTDYLSKPVRRQRLLSTIARYLEPAAPISTPTQSSVLSTQHSLPLKSDLNDESLRTFLDSYLNELPLRVAHLQSSLAQNNLSALSTEIHNLKGTGGLYGLQPITDLATQAETLLRERAPIDALTAQVNSLIHLIQNVEGFPADAKNATTSAAPRPAEPSDFP